LLTKPLNISEFYIELMNHLKYSEVKPVDTGKNIDNEHDKDLINKEELIKQLETTFRDTWLTFEKRQPMSEIKMFGEKLAELGNNHNSGSVSCFGRDLINAADTFNIEAILLLLKQYETKIKDLKSQSN